MWMVTIESFCLVLILRKRKKVFDPVILYSYTAGTSDLIFIKIGSFWFLKLYPSPFVLWYTEIARFEMEYDTWVVEQRKKDDDLRKALVAHTSDRDLRILVESGLNHYYELFRMKADAFYLMNGLSRTPVEQWIGGFRPSALLRILTPQLELLDMQLVDMTGLRQSCEQAEEALSQGLDKLQQTLAQSITMDTCARKRPEELDRCLNQANNVRQETLHQMYRLLTARQAAGALLALGEHLQRLGVLSSL